MLKHWTLTDLRSSSGAWESFSNFRARTIARGFVRFDGPPDLATCAHGRTVLRAPSARLGRTVQASALVRCASESE